MATDLPWNRTRGRCIGKEDKIVWLSGWRYQPYAEEIEDIIMSMVREEPEYVYA